MGNLCSISIPLDEVVSRCLDCSTGQGNYIFSLEKNVHALRSAIKELTAMKDDVKTRVRLAEEERQMPRKQVQEWISKVEDAQVEINQVVEGAAQEIDKLCLGGYCSNNFKSSYKFGKKVAQKLEFVASLKRDGVFEMVADRMPLATVDPRPSEPTVGMESMFDKVWSCLGQDDVGIVGLFGLGGVGKTTLLTQINNKFLNTPNDFDSVIWVVVSKDLNLQRIQDDIWKRLRSVDESWKQKNQDEKAIEISKILREKKFLLLLDDLWEQVDLKEVGVPLPNKANKSKIIFTTRSKDVCGLMDAHPKIEVECLLWEKAWQLFQQKVGADIFSSHPDILTLAENVAKECGGLPLALITVGRAMASKNTPKQWQHAIDTLRDSASKFSGMEEKVFARLKFSFDNLQNDAHKFCFLYCALFPEDYVIDKSQLIDYWIGEEFLGDYDNLNRTRNEGHHIISTLLNVCLLEDAKDENVKMHDMMRDMALWIVSKNREKKEIYFLVQAGVGLTEAPKIKKWEGAKMISLMRNEIRQVRITLSCPNLTTLLLNHNSIVEINYDFFDHMPNLLVLDLSRNVELRQLPKGILKLVSLQYLNLSWTRISSLPVELGKLVNLKYLNLEGSVFINSIPKNLLSSFLKLQVCNLNDIFVSFDEDLFWEKEGLMEGLESLKDLQELGISIRNATSLQRFGLSEKLQRCTRHLNLQIMRGVRSINVSSLEKLESLTLLGIESLEELEIDWDAIRASIRSVSFFPNLHRVTISHCIKLRDMTWLLFAPNITSLLVGDCDGMKKVLDIEKLGESPEVATNPFSKLQTLSFYDLPQLESIYPNALTFPCLEMISVINCPQLKRLPLNSDSAKGHKITIEGEREWWVNLHWEDEAAQNTFLSCLKENK